MIEAGWLTCQEDQPNLKTNPLANHGRGVVNVVESDKPCRSKPLRDVTTPRRFIYEALQKGGVIPRSGHEEDSCLMHPGTQHNMEACLAVEDLLQQVIDQGRLEIDNKGGKSRTYACSPQMRRVLESLNLGDIFHQRHSSPNAPVPLSS